MMEALRRAAMLLRLILAIGASSDAVHNICLGDSVEGELKAGGLSLDDGSSIDLYSFAGQSGEKISIQLTTTHADLCLMLTTEAGQSLAVIRGTTSEIAYTLPATARYVIGVNSTSDADSLSYNLSVNTPTKQKKEVFWQVGGRNPNGNWRHPSGYFALSLPRGFSKTAGDDAFTLFQAIEARALIGVINLPGKGISLPSLATYALGFAKSLVGDIRSDQHDFHLVSEAGAGVYALEGSADTGPVVGLYIKPGAEMSFIVVAVAPSEQVDRLKDGWLKTVASLKSDYKSTSSTVDASKICGSWQNSSGANWSGGSLGEATTYTFYSQGVVELAQNLKLTAEKDTADSGASSHSAQAGRFVILGQNFFIYLQDETEDKIQIGSFTPQGLLIEGVLYIRSGSGYGW